MMRRKRPAGSAKTAGRISSPAVTAYSRFLVNASPRVGAVSEDGPANGVAEMANTARAAVQHTPGVRPICRRVDAVLSETTTASSGCRWTWTKHAAITMPTENHVRYDGSN